MLLASDVTVTVPAAVAVELDWPRRRRGTPEASALLLRSMLEGVVLVVDLDLDHLRALHLMIQYSDLPLGLVEPPSSRLPSVSISTRSQPSIAATSPS